MANAASKKAQKAEASISTKYLPYIVVATLLFVFSRFIRSEFLFSNVILLIMYSATYVVSYFGVVEATKNNQAGEYYFDAFCVNLASQVLYSFFSWGWRLWCLIPGFLLFQAGSYYMQMKKTPGAATAHTDMSEENTTKKKEKKNRPKMQKMH